MHFEPKFSISNRILTAITHIERANGFLAAAKLSPEWFDAMEHRALVREAHHTTRIEGTKLTLDESERLWRGEEVPGVDPDDARELLNYKSAYAYVREALDQGEPISERMIREIHRRLVVGVRGGSAAPGIYRRVPNYVVDFETNQIIYTPPPAGEIGEMMNALVVWLNQDTGIHPVLVSGIAQFQLVHIHPFLDGNGRTSRLLSTLCLYQAGYDFKRLFTLSEFYDRDRAMFYEAIQGVRDNQMDMTGWLEFFVEGLRTQLIEVRNNGVASLKRDNLVQMHGLNTRQSHAIQHLLLNEEFSLQEYEALCTGVNRRTLQRDLKLLLEKGLLERTGHTNHTTYRLRDA